MPFEKIVELLERHKLVEGIVHGQNAPQQQLVETLVRRQHLSEIQALLGRLPAAEIAQLLAALSADDARLVWKNLPPARADEVLWELSDTLRAELAGDREPRFSGSQVSAFQLVDGRLKQSTITCRSDLDDVHPVWIDLLNASRAERDVIGQRYGVALPGAGDATDLEVSSRFQLGEGGDILLHSSFLLDREGNSRKVPMAFVLHDGILFTVRDEELPVFRLQRRRAAAQHGYVNDCLDLLIDLYGADVEYSADSLEDIYATLGTVGHNVLSDSMSDEGAAAILAEIAEQEDLNGRIRSNILDTQRALSFLMRCKVLSGHQIDDVRQILRDIESLNSHTAFLFDKINFLMDATIGFININQNRRVSQLTSLGIVFMPINVLAGIGGMSEFSMMTGGVAWPLSYGAFIVSMGLIGCATYVALRWLDGRKVRRAAGLTRR